jgi:ABC-2 type transport system ATP-binding protein
MRLPWRRRVPAPGDAGARGGALADPAVMVSACGLGIRFGTTWALREVTLDVARGELFALIGPDGAGKTTFFRLVAGLLRPFAGSVRRQEAGAFGFVPQRFGLYEDLTVEENLRLRARLYGVPKAESARRAADLLDRVGLAPFTRRLAGALSGGMKQKLALVAALLARPSLLLLDEPTTGVDPVSRREFWLLLNGLHHEGLTVLVSTPYMDEAEYATRLGFLDRGRLASLGTRDEILSEYSRPLLQVHSSDRVAVRHRLASVPEVDDVSLFGTRLHVRGAEGTGGALQAVVRRALAGLVPDEAIEPIAPSLEDAFVLGSEQRVEEG